MEKVTRKQWIKFSVVTVLYILFTLWTGGYWLFLGLPIIFDIYISRKIPWGAWKKAKNKTVRKITDWVDAIVFALVAVYIINLFFFQNYKIPSSSLEKSLLVGDYLFVSKLSYGPRIPETPLSFPLAQHTLPILNCKSYLDWPKWNYRRILGTGHIERNDIVVFNFPTGDTVAVKADNPDYYNQCALYGREEVNSDKAKFGDIVYRPVDRRENYVKRCIGLPGETLQMIRNAVFINGKHIPDPKNVEYNYYVETTGNIISDQTFENLNISKDDRGMVSDPSNLSMLGIQPNSDGNYNPVYAIPMTNEALAKLKKMGIAKKIILDTDFAHENVYPYSYPNSKGFDKGWSRDDFGPLWIPKKGATIPLTKDNLALYSRCIANYEHNTLTLKDGKAFINGKYATRYTFKYDYYFMLGDNRHNSLDSRYWGFVPEDHIVGRPIIVWLSVDKDKPGLFGGAIRWNRLFKIVTHI